MATSSEILFEMLINHRYTITHWNVHDFYQMEDGLQFKVYTDQFKGHVCIRFQDQEETKDLLYEVSLGHRFAGRWLAVDSFSYESGNDTEVVAAIDRHLRLAFKAGTSF